MQFGLLWTEVRKYQKFTAVACLVYAMCLLIISARWPQLFAKQRFQPISKVSVEMRKYFHFVLHLMELALHDSPIIACLTFKLTANEKEFPSWSFFWLALHGRRSYVPQSLSRWLTLSMEYLSSWTRPSITCPLTTERRRPRIRIMVEAVHDSCARFLQITPDTRRVSRNPLSILSVVHTGWANQDTDWTHLSHYADNARYPSCE